MATASSHDNGVRTTASIAALTATVQTLVEATRSQATTLESFKSDVYQRLDVLGKPQIALWLSAASVVMLVVIAVLSAGAAWTNSRISPVEERIDRADKMSERNRRDRQDTDKALWEILNRNRGEERDERRLLTDWVRKEHDATVAEFKELRKAFLDELKDMRQNVVPRGELAERHQANQAQFLAFERRLDETRRTLAEVYSPKDAFKELQKQIDELRTLVIRNVGALNSTSPPTTP